MSAGTCRICSCAEDRPCPGGCEWADDAQTLCSACAGPVELAAAIEHARALPAGNPEGPSWPDLLAMILRRGFDVTLEEWADETGLRALRAFLVEHFPDEAAAAGADQTPCELAIALLQAHATRRVVLAGGG